ncbi:MAG: 4-(cytidine 5'-diphospho)-2-C-methyl-D-erythritol kinase [Verrucomicrobia bacterium]|nr:4-(cytidine 5'-diphospho)-2-C-methyl-D-erythritol kinase [Verrucomicrobiota bacterium]MDE3098172.1 4-(cytidine 5'-diphospho)-2-C-methyl-D-erythritol kinase [Verrucomicrobiota bacterium]
MLQKKSRCKVNLLLNILGRRDDGFHELETLLHPVDVCDDLSFQKTAGARRPGVQFSCNEPRLSGPDNLVFRAATKFLDAATISDGVKIHLEKRIPLAAGLGGGSSNAAITLLALNELFGRPLPPARLADIAAALGSDVPFFLQDAPALATGRGEKVSPLENFAALKGAAFLLIHPGFGISTAWAYQNLGRFPKAFRGTAGRAERLGRLLRTGGMKAARKEFYNSLESPAFEKFPVLQLYQQFLLANGAEAALMSGSGSTTFALAKSVPAAEALAEKFKGQFGANGWTAVAAI